MGSQYILFLIIAGVIGLLVGLLLASLFSGGGKNKSEKTTPKELLDAGFVEEARLLYNPKDKKVITELDGAFHSEFSKLTIDDKKRVFDFLTGLQNWINPVNPVQTESPAVETTPLEETSTPFTDFQSEQPFSPAPSEADLITDLQGSLDEPEPFLETDNIEAEPLVEKNLSIAEQISLILEDVIKDTEYKEKGIKLIENQENGVDVWVGLEKFSGIENVPYPEVQQLIRTAAKRWEQEVDNQQTYQN